LVLTDQDLVAVQAAAERLTNSVTILVGSVDPRNSFDANLVNIARQISGVSMNRILIEEAADSVFPGKPSLTLTDGQTANIHYLAAPEGRELPPFLEALSWLGGAEAPLNPETAQALNTLVTPVHILVLMAEACPHCPDTIRAALGLAICRPLFRVSVLDALQFPDMAEKYRVNSTPTVIINDGLTLVGRIGREELAGKLMNAVGSAESLTLVLDSMIKSGRAEDAAELMCRKGQPEPILPIYLSKEFSVRMGALVTMEEALERDPRILDAIVADLIELLFQEEVALRGDTAELLGKIGNPTAISALKTVAAGDRDSDVREAAEEALELLSIVQQ